MAKNTGAPALDVRIILRVMVKFEWGCNVIKSTGASIGVVLLPLSRVFLLRPLGILFRLSRMVLYKTGGDAFMKPRKYSAVKAFFGRALGVAERKAAPDADAKLATLSKETGVSVRALSLFSRISEDPGFTADEAHKDFGRVKHNQAA